MIKHLLGFIRLIRANADASPIAGMTEDEAGRQLFRRHNHHVSHLPDLLGSIMPQGAAPFSLTCTIIHDIRTNATAACRDLHE